MQIANADNWQQRERTQHTNISIDDLDEEEKKHLVTQKSPMPVKPLYTYEANQ